MKKLLKNRKVAVVLTVIIMILSTLAGSNRSMAAEAYDIEQYFVYGYEGGSIQRELDDRIGLAKNLLVVAERNLAVNDPAVKELQDAIIQMETAKTVNEKVDANQKLTAATERMNLVLDERWLSRSDDRYRIQIRLELAACNKAISQDSYNEMAMQYNTEVLGSFPGSVLKMVNGIEELKIFR